MLKKTRQIWKRRAQGSLFNIAGIQDYLDEREQQALEDHMGFRGQYEEHRRFQIDQLKKHGLKPEHSVLEIGCGPLTAGIPVIQYLNANRYVGIDVRSSVLDAAWQQIGKHALSEKNPRLVRSDTFGAAEISDAKFDFVWSFSVLYHLSDELVEKLFARVAGVLAGRFIANVQVDMDNSQWLEFPFIKRSIGDYREAAGKHGLKTRELGKLSDLGFRLEGAERNNVLLEFEL